MVDVIVLPGIVVRQLKRFPDERGSFTEILRSDWKDLVGDDATVQANLSVSYPGIVRAWHKHERGQVDYFVVIKGALKICAFDDETKDLDEIVSSGVNLQVVRIPGQFWHGTKVVSDEASVLVYLVNRLYDNKNQRSALDFGQEMLQVPCMWPVGCHLLCAGAGGTDAHLSPWHLSKTPGRGKPLR